MSVKVYIERFICGSVVQAQVVRAACRCTSALLGFLFGFVVCETISKMEHFCEALWLKHRPQELFQLGHMPELYCSTVELLCSGK